MDLDNITRGEKGTEETRERPTLRKRLGKSQEGKRKVRENVTKPGVF